jgi:hypothetical protein
MKRLCFVVFLSLLCCEKMPISPQSKYFNPNDLARLELLNLNTFWQSDTVAQYAHPDMFSYKGFLQSLRYSGANKYISINVFNSIDSAIQAIKDAKTGSQAPNFYGNQEGPIKGLWWYIPSDSVTPSTSYYGIFAQKWNTIVGVTYPSNSELLINTVLEILKRIDEISM